MQAIFRCLAFLLAFHVTVTWAQSSAPKSPPPLNVSGKWEASAAGFYGQMRQTGSVISGRCYTGANCIIRGAFVGDHVMITANWGHADRQCRRGTFVAPNTGKLSPLVGKWYGEPDMGDGLNRVSADAGELVSYPYVDELRDCGDIVTYELSFDLNSAQLKNPDAPVLAAMAQLLKSDATAKLTVMGHTDATGSAEKNKKLSLDRAQSVKSRLVELCACDPARIRTEGMGPDQPLESNDTPAGRALNRRVEITLGR
jgi:outer membrane protein OmpA-like peptidoglycan-associated protein